MRAVIKHIIDDYEAIDDEIIITGNDGIAVIAFNRHLATDVARWLIRQMPDRNLDIDVQERFWDYKVSIVPKSSV